MSSATAVPASAGAEASSGPSGAPPAAAASVQGQRERRATYERRLRRSLERLSSCLYLLSDFERRVLALRGEEGASRRKVARRLGVEPSRVRTAERSGLRGLRQADRRTGCSAPGSQAGGAIGYVGAPLASERPSGASVDSAAIFGEPVRDDSRAAAEPGTGPAPEATGGVAGEQASGGTGRSERMVAPAAVNTGADGAPSVTLILVALAALTALAVVLLLGRRRPAAAAPAIERPARPPAEPPAAPAPQAPSATPAPPTPPPLTRPTPPPPTTPPATQHAPPPATSSAHGARRAGVAASVALAAVGFFLRRRRRR